ncbi:MAG: amidohydrolase [Alphaproteobacteria bacterium]|nr:amidohydrolase [Alphaproteobacteria bacterium]MBU1514312.1 amidohydrolase [Alphaproteobacteria bacterium]MBU2095956.1 amidohydrolase [Alphaproteobacteria bacterium]MBU2153054.1 amidohydrolase [Alphaproteobacteria bacterium]MBU2308511.1 amidohydrolase [Alphaproteobacteria bacterium]
MKLALLAGAAALLATPALAQNLWISGGPIYTGVAAHPTAEVVIVQGGKITFVGDPKTIRFKLDPTTETIDLKGAALFPGFTDGHAHLRGIGERELSLNLEGSTSASEAMTRVKAYLVGRKATGPVWGRGWIETGWPEGRFLNRGDLDPIAPDRPVLLVRADGHALVANSAALKAAGIDEATPVPAGGDILKGPDGKLTGILVDNAMALVRKLQLPPTEADRRAAFEAAFRVEAAYGWTGVHSMSVSWHDVGLLETLNAEGKTPLRVYNAVDADQAGPLFAGGPRATKDGRIVTRAIKLYEDGALGSRGAALFEPYADAPGTMGLVRTPPEKMAEAMTKAKAAGIQVASHAIGDRGNANVLDLYAAQGVETLRWRIEHAQIVRPADIPRFAKLKVIASMQPSHAIGDLHFAPARLGEARLNGAYAWEDMLKAGVLVVGGSDAPVERGAPLVEFYAAVARKDLKGFSAPDWHPDQALSRAEALKLFTSSAAYARFAESELGTIEAGKRADLTAFSVDLMTAPEADIPKGHAVLTVVDGKVVYRAP